MDKPETVIETLTMDHMHLESGKTVDSVHMGTYRVTRLSGVEVERVLVEEGRSWGPFEIGGAVADNGQGTMEEQDSLPPLGPSPVSSAPPVDGGR